MPSTPTNSELTINTYFATGYNVGDRVFLSKKEYLVVEVNDRFVKIIEINDATKEANILIGCILLAGVLLILAVYFVL